MTLISFLIVLFFGMQTFAMQVGTYECNISGSNDVATAHWMTLESDRLIFYVDMGGEDEVYMLGRKMDSFRNSLLTRNDRIEGVEAREYKLFQHSYDVLRLLSFTHYFDGSVDLDVTLTQVSDTELEIYTIDRSQGELVEGFTDCFLAEEI